MQCLIMVVKKILFTKMNGAGNDFIVIDKTVNKGVSLKQKQISNAFLKRGLISLFNA